MHPLLQDRYSMLSVIANTDMWYECRPSLLSCLEDYWRLMPQYQGVRLEDLEVLRILFGFFPTYRSACHTPCRETTTWLHVKYTTAQQSDWLCMDWEGVWIPGGSGSHWCRDSPLKPAFDRVVQIGDASGIQSPLSFGGFGALSRHLRRLRGAIAEALEVRQIPGLKHLSSELSELIILGTEWNAYVQADSLDRRSLAAINAYNPGLSSAWMMQRAMSVRPGRAPDPQFINTLLSENFEAMEKLGNPVLKPFLQVPSCPHVLASGCIPVPCAHQHSMEILTTCL